jgi:hypothetical protein
MRKKGKKGGIRAESRVGEGIVRVQRKGRSPLGSARSASADFASVGNRGKLAVNNVIETERI